jgi:hypothetical protein
VSQQQDAHRPKKLWPQGSAGIEANPIVAVEGGQQEASLDVVALQSAAMVVELG